jgi:hypothetical protein
MNSENPPPPIDDLLIVQKALAQAGWNFPRQQDTYPDVFIIESLRDEDELSSNFEGLRIAKALRLAGMIPKYFYIHDKKELALLVPLFRQSGYRYLHFSCHGSAEGFDLQRDFLSFKEFANIFSGALPLRRLFVSACSTGERELIDELHKSTRGIQSVIAPAVDISFHHANMIWAALYVSLLEEDDGNMRHSAITEKMRTILKLFPWAEKKDSIAMEFMFAGYNSVMDQGAVPRPEAWTIEILKP